MDALDDCDFDHLEEPPRRFRVRNAQGARLATLVRLPDKFMWWEGPDGQLGLNGQHPSDFLYGVEHLRHVPLDIPVVVSEGPKDRDACRRAGLVAVGTLTGAGGVPTTAALEPLRDRLVVVWPDADPAGAEHMRRVADVLAHIAREIRLVDVAGLPLKAGAADLSSEAIVRRVARARVVHARVGRDSDSRRRKGT